MKEIKKKMPGQFEYRIYEARDGLYGTINDNDEWNGMISDLVTGVCSHTHAHTRAHTHTHTPPLSRKPT
jgi:hypothetical protein